MSKRSGCLDKLTEGDIHKFFRANTVTSAQIRFSKFKLLKNYFSTMTQHGIDGLATLCIVKRLLDDFVIDPIISDFASSNVRRIFLRQYV
jgi:hypothetical protein